MGSTPVFIYGFDELTEPEHDAVETLARVVDTEVTLSLAYEPGRRVFSARAGSFERLQAFANTQITLEANEASYAESARQPLHLLERALFEFAADRQTSAEETISLTAASDEFAELALLAEQITTLLADGYRAEEIALVYRNPERYSVAA